MTQATYDSTTVSITRQSGFMVVKTPYVEEFVAALNDEFRPRGGWWQRGTITPLRWSREERVWYVADVPGWSDRLISLLAEFFPPRPQAAPQSAPAKSGPPQTVAALPDGLKTPQTRTAAWELAVLKHRLATDGEFATAALLAIYSLQTLAEQAARTTSEDNTVGFTGADAEFLTSIAQGCQRYGRPTERQLPYVLKRMPKYAGQLVREGLLADERERVLSAAWDAAHAPAAPVAPVAPVAPAAFESVESLIRRPSNGAAKAARAAQPRQSFDEWLSAVAPGTPMPEPQTVRPAKARR